MKQIKQVVVSSSAPSENNVWIDPRDKGSLKIKKAGVWQQIGGQSAQSDWNQNDSSKDDYIKNKPALKTVATTGSYNDLTDKPSVPYVIDFTQGVLSDDFKDQIRWNDSTEEYGADHGIDLSNCKLKDTCPDNYYENIAPAGHAVCDNGDEIRHEFSALMTDGSTTAIYHYVLQVWYDRGSDTFTKISSTFI